MNTTNATPFTIHYSSMLMIFLPTCPWLSSPHQVSIQYWRSWHIFRRHYGQRNVVDYRDTPIFPRFRGNSSTETYDVYESAVGLPTRVANEESGLMKALYAASVNG